MMTRLDVFFVERFAVKNGMSAYYITFKRYVLTSSNSTNFHDSF